MATDPVFENPGIEITDDTEVPVILSGAVTGAEYVTIHIDEGGGNFTLKKILLSELKIFMNA